MAQSRLPPGVRGPASGMATRDVSHYLMLERAVAQAVADHDDAGLRTRLADDFTVRDPNRETALGADEWMRSSAPGNTSPDQVRALSVHTVDNVAMVTFLLDRRRAGHTTTRFVVDLWSRSREQLLSRAVSNPRSTPTRPSRPSGRE